MGAHPRVCGENAVRAASALKVAGSSPRVRGKRTPSAPTLTFTGSSPRVRGKRSAHESDERSLRLIPACAGKTAAYARCRPLAAAHPRVCGENLMGKYICENLPGSSPRVRGKHATAYSSVHLLGLIPACAGKTARRGPRRRISWAHPRVCGENRHHVRTASCEAGSSPRVRGKRFESCRGRKRRRLIPACAGKTRPREQRQVASTAHPRVCGENVDISIQKC